MKRGPRRARGGGLAPFGATAATGSVSLNYNLVYQYTVDYAGTLNKDFTTNMSSQLSAGMQLSKRRSESEGISGNGLVANQLNLISSVANRDASQSFFEQTSLGFFVLGLCIVLSAKAELRDRNNTSAKPRFIEGYCFIVVVQEA